jgi:hypothetical protein
VAVEDCIAGIIGDKVLGASSNQIQNPAIYADLPFLSVVDAMSDRHSQRVADSRPFRAIRASTRLYYRL